MSARNSQGKLAARHGYTLVELLTVLTIIMLLLLVSVPLFGGFSGRNAMKGAVAQVQATLGLARQYSIANNEVVFFVIAGPINSGGGAQNYVSDQANKCLRAYAVYSIGRDTSDSLSGRRDDKYLTNWEYLPDGIVFDYDESSIETDANLNANLFAALPLNRAFKFPASDSAESENRNFHYVKFTPDGRASWKLPSGYAITAQPGAIILAEGSTLWATPGIDVSDSAQYFVLPNRSKAGVELYRNTGRFVVTELLKSE